MKHRICLAGTVALVALSTAACKVREGRAALRATAADDADVAPGTCVAIRGNGPAVLAHFAALARLSEFQWSAQ